MNWLKSTWDLLVTAGIVLLLVGTLLATPVIYILLIGILAVGALVFIFLFLYGAISTERKSKERDE